MQSAPGAETEPELELQPAVAPAPEIQLRAEAEAEMEAEIGTESLVRFSDVTIEVIATGQSRRYNLAVSRERVTVEACSGSSAAMISRSP